MSILKLKFCPNFPLKNRNLVKRTVYSLTDNCFLANFVIVGCSHTNNVLVSSRPQPNPVYIFTPLSVLPCPILPCPILPCPALSSFALSYPALSHLVLPYPTLSCPIPPCPALYHLVLPYPTLSCPIPSCPALSHPVFPYPNLPCPFPPCLAIPMPRARLIQEEKETTEIRAEELEHKVAYGSVAGSYMDLANERPGGYAGESIIN